MAVVASGGGGDDGGGGNGGGGKAPEGALRIPFVLSPEKEAARAADQGVQREARGGGRPLGLRGGRSRRAATPSRGSPAAGSSRWPGARPRRSGGGCSTTSPTTAARAADNPSIVRTPLVIAMWEPFAKALGWPRKKIGFEQIIGLARSNRDAAYGKPEFGSFKLVHTNPDFSTSGLSAVVAEYYAATGKKEGLTGRDVTASVPLGCQGHRALDRPLRRHHAVHRGRCARRTRLRLGGGDGGHAAGLQPQPRLAAEAGGALSARGHFYSDNPFIVLDAPWVSGSRGGCEEVPAVPRRRDLAGAGRPLRLPAGGPRQDPVDPISKASRVDPAEPERVLGLPEPRVLAKVKETWRADRKPVLWCWTRRDRCRRTGWACRAGAPILPRGLPNDRVGLIFSDRLQPLVPISSFARAAAGSRRP